MEYFLAAAFVRHLSHLEAIGQRDEFPAVFDLIEALCLDGSHGIRELAVIGFLEDLQNTNMHEAPSSPGRFVQWLRPVSRAWWDEVERFWAELGGADAFVIEGGPVPWRLLREAFEVDGSLRDLVIPGASVGTWDAALTALRALVAETGTRIETDPDPLPTTTAGILALAESESVAMHISAGPMELHAHFFDASEVELDLDPAHIGSAEDAAVVLDTIIRLAWATGREVLLTPENWHDAGWLSFDPSAHRWRWLPRTGTGDGPWRRARRQSGGPASRS
jgi:hypothetical protein